MKTMYEELSLGAGYPEDLRLKRGRDGQIEIWNQMRLLGTVAQERLTLWLALQKPLGVGDVVLWSEYPGKSIHYKYKILAISNGRAWIQGRGDDRVIDEAELKTLERA